MHKPIQETKSRTLCIPAFEVLARPLVYACTFWTSYVITAFFVSLLSSSDTMPIVDGLSLG
jgi:hypothetical protein